MRAFAITGMVTASWISRILSGSAMRATPPSARMSAGTRSSAITATAPASSAMLACSAVVTSMITPPLSISARPDLTRIVPVSAIGVILASRDQTPNGAFLAFGHVRVAQTQLACSRKGAPNLRAVEMPKERAHEDAARYAAARPEDHPGHRDVERRLAGSRIGPVDHKRAGRREDHVLGVEIHVELAP